MVLAGNPNAGKTTLFNALTKSRLTTGNWHGVTTRPAYKAVGGIVFADVPGMYSFNSYSMEEDSAAAEIRAADAVINVVDGLTLANSLTLTRAIIAINKNVVVYVTKLKQLKRRGGRIDFFALSRLLGVPVTGSLKELKAELFRITDSKQNFCAAKMMAVALPLRVRKRLPRVKMPLLRAVRAPPRRVKTRLLYRVKIRLQPRPPACPARTLNGR